MRANLTQEQLSEVAGFNLKFYQQIESGRKAQLKVETVERLGRPFGLEPWQLLAPEKVCQEAAAKFPAVRSPSPRGPRAKWQGCR